MKKDNKIMKFASFVLLITVTALILVSGTYAKYTSSATGTDTAVVAKWDIKAGKNGGVLASLTEGNISFDLFETINDEATGVVETDVTSGKIAPGTKGEFELAIQNDSEVTAEYTIDFTVTKGVSVSDAAILFSLDNGNTWTSDLTDITATRLDMDNTSTTDVDESKTTVKVMWKWAYETTNGDAKDTTVGTNATAATEETAKTITVTAKLTATQVD